MKLGLIYDRIKWEEKELIKSFREKGLEYDALNVGGEDNSFNLSISDEKVDSDIFLQRCTSYYKGLYSTAIFESIGFKVVNSYEVAKICGDKLLTTLHLIQKGIPTPKTYTAFSKAQALKILGRLGYPAILKPLVGSWGRQVALLKDEESAYAILSYKEESINPIHKIFYLQEYVPVKRDIRVFLVGDMVAAAMYRYKVENDWRSNAVMGAKTEPCPITDEIVDLSLKVKDALKGEVLGIDLMESDRGLLVSEVNHTPQFKSLTATTGVKVSDLIVNYLTKCAKR